MESGILKILGEETYKEIKAQAPCEHESDGLSYSPELSNIQTLRCTKCGTFYTKKI